jgi:L-alanine-DL-glutamate epimerase-like enolase superfamily enzyme
MVMLSSNDPLERDWISWIKLRSVNLPLQRAVSDAKVLTGRQRALDSVSLLFAEIETAQGHCGMGFSYSLRAGGPAQYAHALEVAPLLIGEDPNDIARLWSKLVWAGASVGRSGVAVQTIWLWDVPAFGVLIFNLSTTFFKNTFLTDTVGMSYSLC